MSVYSPPSESLQEFNIDVFNQPDDTISQGEGGLLYLSKVDSDTSTAPSTTFNGAVIFNTCPESNVEPSANKNLTTKYYVDFNYLSKTLASTTYQTITGMTAYLTTAVASATYQTISGMTAYLTTAVASATYQTISGMTAYLTTAVASTTYLTIANASSTYLSITNAIANYARLGSANIFTAINQFNQPIQIHSTSVSYTDLEQTGNNFNIYNRSIEGKTHIFCRPNGSVVDTDVALFQTSGITLGISTGNNAISGLTTFNSIPSCSVNPSSNYHLINKFWIDTYFLTIANAASTYLTSALAATTYLTIANATSTYLSITNAASTYLTQANAITTYLSITNASSTYLTQSNAISNYARLSSTNTFTNTNTFSNTTNLNGQLNLKNKFVLYDLTSPNTKNIIIYQSGNDISFEPDTLVGGANTIYYFSALNSGGTNVNILKLTSSDATINGNAIITGTANITGTSTLGATNISGTTSITGGITISGVTTLSGATTSITGTTTISGGTTISGATTISNALTISNNTTFSSATINIDSSTASHSVNLFSAITSGTINLFSSLANSAVNMFSSSSNDTTLNINAKVKFRQVKLYNQVKTITGTATLTFALEETILINSAISGTITLPLINSTTQLGMTFNFIKNYTNVLITFTTQGTNTIMLNGSATGVSSSILLGFGQTSTQLVCMEVSVGSGVYNWVVMNSSLPPQITNPPGSIIQMAGTSVPAGYLACSGGLFLTTTYPELYAIIGLTYGGGSGFFGIPNFNNGSFLRGYSSGITSAYGTQQSDNIKTHTHTTLFYRYDKGSNGGTDVISDLTGGQTGSTNVASNTNTAGSPDETRPINYAVYYCIKY